MKLIDRKPKDDKRRHETVSFRCTVDVAEYLRLLAVKYNTSVSDVILQLIGQAQREDEFGV